MENDELFFEITDSGDYIRVSQIEYVDTVWLKARIEIKAGTFAAKYKANLMARDFESFKNELNYVYTHLSGQAAFTNTEDYLIINLKGDGIGHFEVNCKACDNPGYMGRTLDFYFVIDQTQIMPLVRQLDAITAQFPAL